jgi:hypothetical protein
VGWSWDEMLEAFRALGGVADNVVMQNGPRGRGLFPANPDEPVRVFAPENLLFPVSDLEFIGGRLKLKDSARADPIERSFFERYQETFSWGGGGRAECATFLARLSAVPSSLQDSINEDLRLEAFFEGEKGATNRTESRFLGTRMIMRRERFVVTPVLELANHAPDGPLLDLKLGAELNGTFPEEVRFRYAVTDPIGVFTSWGFASPEATAFSLPMALKIGERKLVIQRNLGQATAGGKFRPPVVARDGDTVTLSHLMLGSRGFPKLAKTHFYAAMKDVGDTDAEGVFDSIAHHNRTRFLNVLELLDDRPGDLVREMRRMARYQLKAMSYCLGERHAETHTESPREVEEPLALRQT